jgi:hypothetical protein
LAKLSLAVRARFPRTEEDERQDTQWIANDEAICIAPEGAGKKAEDTELVEAAADGWHEAYDGWYEAAEEGPDPAAEEEADAVAGVDGEEAVHGREMAKLNVSIKERLTELMRETTSTRPPSGPVTAVWATSSAGRTSSSLSK